MTPSDSTPTGSPNLRPYITMVAARYLECWPSDQEFRSTDLGDAIRSLLKAAGMPESGRAGAPTPPQEPPADTEIEAWKTWQQQGKGQEPPAMQLERYGIEWQGPEQPIAKLYPDGYWTPWHVADAELAALRSEVSRLQQKLSAAQGEAWFHQDRVAYLEAEVSRLRAQIQEKAKNWRLVPSGMTAWDDGYESGLIHCAEELEQLATDQESQG